MWAGNCSSTRICLGSAEGRWRLRDKPGGTAAQSYLQTSANLLEIGTVYNQKHARRVAEMLIFQAAAILYAILQKMAKQNNGKKLEKTPGFVMKPGVFWSCWADSNCRPHPYQSGDMHEETYKPV